MGVQPKRQSRSRVDFAIVRCEMIIESLAPHRLDDAVDLWRQVGLTRPWNDPRDDLRRALASPSSTVLAGIEGDTLIATAMVGHDGHRGWVYYLAVCPDMRRHGHGRAIMNACEAWLDQRHVPKLNIMVRSDNTAAAGFYEALGYSPDDVIVLSRRLHQS
jgi:ribosomal protein S18 acetylase RimI-like enzyme